MTFPFVIRGDFCGEEQLSFCSSNSELRLTTKSRGGGEDAIVDQLKSIDGIRARNLEISTHPRHFSTNKYPLKGKTILVLTLVNRPLRYI